MLFGLLMIPGVVVGSAVFALLAIVIDNFGDKCIELIDGRR